MADIASLQIKVDATSTDQAVKSLDKLTEATKKTETASTALKKSWADEQSLINERAKAIMDADIAMDAAKDKAWALANGYKESGGLITRSTNETSTSLKGLGLNTKQARHEMMILGKEVITGDFSRIPKTLGTLITQSNILPSLISPIGIAIGVTTAAAVAGAYIWSTWGDNAKAALKKAEDGLEKISKKASAAQRPTQVQELTRLEYEIKSAEIDARIQSEIGRDETHTREIRSIAYKAAGQYRLLAEGLKKQKSDLEDKMRIEIKPDKKEKEKKIPIDREAEKAARDYARALEEANRILANIDPQVKANQEWEKLLTLQEKLGDQFPLTAEQMGLAYANAMGGIKEDTKDTFDEMSEFAKQAGRNMQDALADFLFDPMKDGFDGMLRSFGRMLQRMAAEAAAANILRSIGAWGSTGGGAGTAIGSAAAAIFGGGKADGGSVSSGNSYMVGERGPELFTPATSGKIESNKSGRQISVINNFTISTPTDRRTQEQIAAMAGMSVNRALARNT